MKTCWPSICVSFFTLICAVHSTYHLQSAYRCLCNGKARYCRSDTLGLYCVDCQHNTTGRHCESCKDGHYHLRAGESCSPCHCNPIGSAGPNCDSRGQCSCSLRAVGSRCDLCPDGRAVTAEGCHHSGQQQADQPSVHQCFCYGHSSSCSQSSAYSVYNISSSFTNGPEGWRTAAPAGVPTSDVHFRWSPKYQDLEVISKHSLPVYLYAPSGYLGDQVLSYGQNLSFSLRLDRGERYPSTSDVVLEGSGHRVSAALGPLRSIVPSGVSITYNFRLDEGVDSKWRPQLSSTQFQRLLHNLTALKIRASFGQDGRGYLDNANLVSARRGAGIPAAWAWQCSCPEGYTGERCERCAAGFKHATPSDGAFSPCQPCRCAGGCDSETGECFSADQSDAGQGCSPGYYSNSEHLCIKCPCPHGVDCSVNPRTLRVTCDTCPPGITSSHCHICEEGFYGDPQGMGGQPRPCQRCHCNGHVDAGATGNCDRVTGACLKCVNNTRGQHCESCTEGYYHTHTNEKCALCGCSVQGSVSVQCSDKGQCVCREGYEGLRCQRSSCPACFDPIKTKVEGYAEKLQELEKMFWGAEGGGHQAGTSAQMEQTLRDAEHTITQLQENADTLGEMEKGLQSRLSVISKDQLRQDHSLQGVADTVDGIAQRQQAYRTHVSTVQSMIEEMRNKLVKANVSIQSAGFPQRDTALGSDGLSSLVDKATQLAHTHQQQAEQVEQIASEALSHSQQSLGLVRNLMNRENHVKQLIGELKNMYDHISFQVKALESQASQVSVEAADESSMSGDMMTRIHTLETNLPAHLQEELQGVLSQVEELEEQVDSNITASQSVQDDVQELREEVENQLDRGKAALKDYERNLARVNAAKAETDAAVKIINVKHNDVISTLNTMRGFDESMGVRSAEADEAISRLPAINRTVQQAVASNTHTLSILNGVAEHFLDAQGTQDHLRTLTATLEGMCASLPPHGDLVNDATTLNVEVQGIAGAAEEANEKLTVELNDAESQRLDAEEASLAASGSYAKARDTREAVSTTLQAVNNLLSVIGQPGSVDEARLTELENTLGDARSQVIGQLKPRLQEMEEKEAGQRSRLAALNVDIDSILRDITNLEDILKTIPEGCYNSLPQEHA